MTTDHTPKSGIPTQDPTLRAGSPCPDGCITGYPGRKEPELLKANIDGELSCPSCWECFGIVTAKPEDSPSLAAKDPTPEKG